MSEDTLPTWTTDSCSPPETWEDSSLTPALSRLSYGVRPGISELFILFSLTVLRGLTVLQGWRWRNLSWAFLHCWAVSMGKTLFLLIRLSISYCSLWPLSFILLLFALRSSFSITSSLILSERRSKNRAAPWWTQRVCPQHKECAPDSGVRLLTVTSNTCCCQQDKVPSQF